MRRILLQTLAWSLAFIGLTSVTEAQWVAFNDHVPGNIGTQTSSNATTLKIPVVGGPTTTNIALKNVSNGTNLPVTLTISRSANGVLGQSQASIPASGTPLCN